MSRKEIEIEILKKAEKKLYDYGRHCKQRHSMHPAYLNGLFSAEIMIADLRKKLK